MNASYVNIVQCHNNGGIIINREGNDLFIKDKDSEVYYLLCDDVDKALKWLKEYGKCYCLELYNEELFDMLRNYLTCLRKNTGTRWSVTSMFIIILI